MITLVIESLPSAYCWSIEGQHVDFAIDRSDRVYARRKADSLHWEWGAGEERFTAFDDEMINASELWGELLDPVKHEVKRIAAERLIDGLYTNLPDGIEFGRIVFLIPDATPELSQNALISELSGRFSLRRSEIYLLWRPVALALADIEKDQNTTDRIILDLAHSSVEGVHLEVTKKGDTFCPVRDFNGERYTNGSQRDMFNSWIAKNYGEEQCVDSLGGARSEALLNQKLDEGLLFEPPRLWTETAMTYTPCTATHAGSCQSVDLRLITDDVVPYVAKFKSTKRVVWHGWAAYSNGEFELRKSVEDSSLLEYYGAIRGGAVFAERFRKKLPTYYEELPGYDIWCQSGSLGFPKTRGWEPLLENTRILGTDTVEAEPQTDFHLKAGTHVFALNVRLGDSLSYRFVEETLPSKVDENTPIEVHSEIRPTGGGVKITLRPAGRTNLFGQSGEVALRWDEAVELVGRPVGDDLPTSYGYPFIINFTGDDWMRNQISSIVSAVGVGRDIGLFEGLHDLMKQKRNPYSESYIDAFGNLPIKAGLTEEWEQFIAELNDYALEQIDRDDAAMDRKWIGTAGRLFHYASEEFQNKIFKGAFQLPFTPGGSTLAAMCRWALGRTCRKPDHLDAYVRKALSEWSNMRGMEFWLFWPFCKALSYYGENARISRESALGVFRCGSDMLNQFIQGTVPPTGTLRNNWLKWTLSALLFGLRVREVYPSFLPAKDPSVTEVLDSELCEEYELMCLLKKRLKHTKIYNEPIPPASLAGLDVSQRADAPTLPELVIRFLESTATEADMVIAGGIGRSS